MAEMDKNERLHPVIHERLFEKLLGYSPSDIKKLEEDSLPIGDLFNGTSFDDPGVDEG
jgi:hypothetical protein